MVTTTKQWLLAVLERAGYTVIPNWRLAKHPQASYLKLLLKFLDVDCILDVGANLGQFRDFLRDEVGFDGIIISFEPISDLAQQLQDRAKRDNKWLIKQFALGSAEGRAPFNVMASSQFSSFLSPEHSLTPMFLATNVVTRIVDVEIRTLDAILPELRTQLGFSSVYLKLDTQGFDLEVMKGAGQSLECVRGLQTEVSVTPIYSGVQRYEASLPVFESLGFEISGVFPNNPQHFPHLVEFDCHMISRAFLRRAD